ncbi:uncharacterized protein LOC134186129 [Corticium candelabrum]|uniref:uncharacterized protein LOC134186129 n=1 Tax=Corticium candelabrum TaxID=121492 RepID=UPI002E2543AB|nr:uncharacterized protein LOC134186129 [Corticium candelabrum]
MASKLDEIPLLALQNKETQRVIVNVDDDDLNVDVDEKAYSVRSVSLWFSDFFHIFVDFVQFYALFLSLSFRWAWPYSWITGINGTQPAFLVNVDVWNFRKVMSGAYVAKDTEVYSNRVGLDYIHYIVGWMIGVATLCLVAFGVWLVLHCRNSFSVFVQKAFLRRIVVFVCQLMCVPYGVAAARLFHCVRLSPDGESELVLEVKNNVSCWSWEHLAYCVPAGGIFVLGVVLVVCWMIFHIRSQLFSPLQSRHEGYVELKEAEYSQQMDVLWAVGNFFLFSSFKRRFVWYHPFSFVIKGVFVILFASLFSYPTQQIITMTGFSLCLTIFFLVVRPFRLVAFNVLLVISWFVLACYALLGALLQMDVENALLTGKYLEGDLIVLSSSAAILFLFVLAYLVLHHFQICCSKPLWPSLFQPGANGLDENTARYMCAILRGRKLLEVCYHTAPMLAPSHELSRQIQIINAYCREAEQLGDPIHDTLWDLLDELIEAHNNVSSESIYSASSKKTIHKIAKELNGLMPEFRRRLDQREHDFILMSPVKRRMLLKMYVIGIFVNGRAEKLKLAQQTAHIKIKDVSHMEGKQRNVSIGTFAGSVVEDEHYQFMDEVENVPDGSSTSLSTPPSRGGTADSRDNLLKEVEEMFGHVSPVDID